MFQRNEFGLASGGAAVLAFDAALSPAADQDRPGFKQRIEIWAAEQDLVVDLGARIGSRDWWRGLATCTALCATVIAFAPSIRPFDTQPEAQLGAAQWDEARTLAIAPLAYGADTGKRMAPTDAVEPLAETPERPSVDLSATLGQGDGFARVLERAGVAPDQAKQVADMVGSAVSLGDVKPGTRIDLTLGRRPNKSVARPLDHLSFRARFELALAVERIDGQLRLKRIPIAVDNTPLRIQGVVGSSLYRSARAAGAPAKAVETYLRTIGQRLSIGRDVRSDDRFDLIVEHRRAATGEVEVGGLLYAGLDQGKRRIRLLKWETGGRTEWFEAAGVGQSRGMMRTPVAGRMTSGFGMRLHPLLGYSRFHKGVDFGAAHGSPIVAAADGVIAFAGWRGGHGKFVKINHSGGLGTGYGHMSRIVARPGQRIAQGQVIGYVGSTGLSTGPHLHYEVYKNGVAINPRSISFIQTAQLAGAELARFRARLNQLLAVKPGAGGTKREETQSAEAKSEKGKKQG